MKHVKLFYKAWDKFTIITITIIIIKQNDKSKTLIYILENKSTSGKSLLWA